MTYRSCGATPTKGIGHADEFDILSGSDDSLGHYNDQVELRSVFRKMNRSHRGRTREKECERDASAPRRADAVRKWCSEDY